MLDLDGKVVLITGGSEGYGRATAKRLTDEGAVVVIAARNEEKLKEAQEKTGCAGRFTMDVTCAADWDRTYDFIIKKYGRLDVLINNAGGGVAIKDTVEQSVEDIDRAILLNLNSVIYGSRVFGKLMIEQKQGTIINMASVCAKQAWPQWSVYASAKWGVLGFSKGLYVEMQPHNVRVTCVIPAAASTGFQKNANIGVTDMRLRAEDVAQVITGICKLPEHVVVEEVTVWGNDQVVIPL